MMVWTSLLLTAGALPPRAALPLAEPPPRLFTDIAHRPAAAPAAPG